MPAHGLGTKSGGQTKNNNFGCWVSGRPRAAGKTCGVRGVSPPHLFDGCPGRPRPPRPRKSKIAHLNLQLMRSIGARFLFNCFPKSVSDTVSETVSETESVSETVSGTVSETESVSETIPKTVSETEHGSEVVPDTDLFRKLNWR